jgi:CDP-diacylglycerol--serine O-phosphatidyltransferase
VAACIAVVIAGLLDGIDGRVARLTGTQSDFGVQFDSLSDMVSFGVAPAVLVWTWSLSSVEMAGPIGAKIGWLSAFFYAACAALRLARFNTQAGVADKRYFQGLASPAAAGTLVSTIWFCESRGIGAATVAWPTSATSRDWPARPRPARWSRRSGSARAAASGRRRWGGRCSR